MVKKIPLSNVLVKSNSCFLGPKPLVKTTIPIGQCKHLNQIKPFENSCFLVVNVQNYIIYFKCKFSQKHYLNFVTEYQISMTVLRKKLN